MAQMAQIAPGGASVSFHLFLDEKVEPKVNHDQSPDGSATTRALRTGTPTIRPALIPAQGRDGRPRTQPAASKHARERE